MKKFFFAFLFLIINNLYPQNEAGLKILYRGNGNFIFVIQHEFHEKYGLGFPLTFRFIIPIVENNLQVQKKDSSKKLWSRIPEKDRNGIFNDEEAVCYNYEKNCAFVSAAFGKGDSLFIRICNSKEIGVNAYYTGITKYYDNRKAAVTISADDYYDEYNSMFKSLLDLFRSYGLYTTVGVSTSGVTRISWNEIQDQLNKGYVEIASHSRTHPMTPYTDARSEVCESLGDIIKNLTLPKYYNVNNKEYVYVWLAPSGDYDSEVDSLLTVSNYLVSRLYLNLPVEEPRKYTCGDSRFAKWNAAAKHFEPFYPTVEFGAPYWGGGDTSLTSLNNLFDSVIDKGDIYHPMWHPQVLYDDINKSYLRNHLSYISRHPDIWYVNLGPLYLYHLIHEANKSIPCVYLQSVEHLSEPLQVSGVNSGCPNSIMNIKFELAKNEFVNVSVYSETCGMVTILANQNMNKGIYEINLDSSEFAGGTYICRLTVGADVIIKKIVL